MRIGVYAPGISAEQGGAFTITHEIAAALGLQAAHSQHELITISEVPFPVEKPSFFRRVLRRLGVTFKTREQRITEWLRAQKIDFVLNLVPWEVLSFDIPYATIVWDLQHRLQPFFPEVSEHGEWQKREDNYKVALQRASRVIVGTEEGAKEVELFYQVPSERIRILPHPTPDFSKVKADYSILSRHKISELYLFYPAQFWPHKNHVGLLLALHALKEKHGLYFSMVFSGADKGNQAYVKEVAEKLGLMEHVHFLGFVTREELKALYEKAFAVTYASFFGPENLPPLEAFSLGCPVIAARVSGAKEQMGDNAILVNPGKPEELAFSVNRLHHDRTLRDYLVKKGFERANYFTPEHFAASALQMCDEFESIRRCWSNSFVLNELPKTARLPTPAVALRLAA